MRTTISEGARRPRASARAADPGAPTRRETRPNQSRQNRRIGLDFLAYCPIRTFQRITAIPIKALQRPSARQGSRKASSVRRAIDRADRRSRDGAALGPSAGSMGGVSSVSDPMFSIAWAPNCATSSRSRPRPVALSSAKGLAPFWVADCVFSIACGAIRRRFVGRLPSLRPVSCASPPDHPRKRGWTGSRTGLCSRRPGMGGRSEPIPVSNPSGDGASPKPCRELKTSRPSPFFSVSTRPPEGLKAAAALGATGAP